MRRGRNCRAGRRLGLVLALLLPAAGPGAAQDTHYWNNQYGPRATLLGGLLVGSVDDMSATFYNPGAIGYIEDPELVLSANVYQRSKLTVRDGAGLGLDLESGDFRPVPNLVAGALRFSWLGPNRLGYAVLTRQRFEAEVRFSAVGRVTDVQVPGESDFAGATFFSGEANETWIGGTWARQLGERVGVGVTPFLSIRSHGNESQTFAQVDPDSGDLALIFDVERFEATHYSLLAKIGIGVDLRPVTAGLTVTTPGVQLAGSGEYTSNLSFVRLVQGEPDGFEATVQRDVAGERKSPLSLAVGAAAGLGRARIHGSVEWFDAVAPYDVLELAPFTSQYTGEQIVPVLRDAAQSVTNWGVGIETTLGARVRGYASFTTDHSSAHPESDLAVTTFDIYHVAGGSSIAVGRSSFTLGLAYAWGGKTVPRDINLDPDEEEGVVLEPESKAEIDYRRLTFVFGFGVQL